jgi:regulator of protease activity HflC (stomatin/prohibitin superfamily)
LPAFDKEKLATYYPNATENTYSEAAKSIDNWLNTLWNIRDNQLVFNDDDQKLMQEVCAFKIQKSTKIQHLKLVNEFLIDLEYTQQRNTNRGEVMQDKTLDEQIEETKKRLAALEAQAQKEKEAQEAQAQNEKEAQEAQAQKEKDTIVSHNEILKAILNAKFHQDSISTSNLAVCANENGVSMALSHIDRHDL